MDLKSLTQQLANVRSHAFGGALTLWQILALIGQIIQFIQQFHPPTPAPSPSPDGTDNPQHITFGAAPVDAIEFSAMVDEVCVSLGVPLNEEIIGGIGERLAEQALAKLIDAIRQWMAAQGYQTIFDLLLAVLGQLTPPTHGAAE